jgi:hypothetical protein
MEILVLVVLVALVVQMVDQHLVVAVVVNLNLDDVLMEVQAVQVLVVVDL